MKKILHSRTIRLVLLTSIMLGMAALHVLDPLTDEQSHIAENKAESINRHEARARKFGMNTQRPTWEPSGEDIFVAPAAPIPEPEISTTTIAPPEPVAPPPPPAPVVPPLPYTALAKFKNDEQTIIYLGSDKSAIPAREGDLLDNGQYQIEKISGTSVSIRYLPMNHLHELSLSGLE